MVKHMEPCGEHNANYSFAFYQRIPCALHLLRNTLIFEWVNLNPLPSLVKVIFHGM